MIELSIVTGTYQRLASLQRMINSARAAMPSELPHEFVLVDGGSTDGTQAWCRTQPDIRLIEQGELLGGIAAFNAGFAVAEGRYVLIANDDIVFLEKAITRALVFMDSQPTVGCGCFEQDRNGMSWHIAVMPAQDRYGRVVAMPYGQVCIVPKWLGDECQWWTLPGARTYGGDNALSSRIYEAGYDIQRVPDARIHDMMAQDGLRAINSTPTDNSHPDTLAYYKLFPRGAKLPAEFKKRDLTGRAYRILYAPIYEQGHSAQHQQKRGLRKALGKIGIVVEVDYLAGHNILAMAADWRPDLVVTQFHDSHSFTEAHVRELKKLSGTLVNWNGDVYDRSDDGGYVALLRHFDMAGFVNQTAVERYQGRGIRATYWQIGYEVDGIGYLPDADTPKTDLIFLGNGYSPDRQAFGTFLARLPYSLGLYGDGWQAGLPARPSTLYDFRTGCKLINNAKVVLGDSQWPDAARGFVSNRLFQSMAAGGALLMHQRFAGMEELLGLKDGVHLVVWNDYDELAYKLAHYLDPAHEKERAQIARAGQAEVLRNHSFDKRVREMRAFLTPPESVAPPAPAAPVTPSPLRPELDPLLAAFHEVHSG